MMNKKIFYLIFSFLNVFLLEKNIAQVVINEYSAANYNQFLDNFGGTEDWIELYNTSAKTVDVSGYYLSDNATKPKKWQFKDSSFIAPKGFLRVWCSSRDISDPKTGHYHTNFKLTQTKKTNERLVLSDKNGKVLQDIVVTETMYHQSWSRFPDGGSKWMINIAPSPNDSNKVKKFYKAFAEKPKVDVAGGFYDKNQTIKLSTTDTSLVIRYTLDGKEPKATSPIYKNPILIDTVKVLKARSFSKDSLVFPSFVQFNTYFVKVSHSLIVLSITGDSLTFLATGAGSPPSYKPLGSFEYFLQDKTPGSKGYGEYNSHGQDSWKNKHRSLDFEMRDEMGYNDVIGEKIFDLSTREEFQKVILRAAGDDNYPANLDAQNKGSAHMRDAYIQNLAKRGGLKLDVRTAQKAIVYLNGEYWGVYDIRERPDDHDYPKHYYNQDKYNIQYIQTWGSTWAEHGGPKALSDWNVLYNYILKSDVTKDSVYQNIKAQYDVESLVDYMLVNTFTVCSDWLNYNTGWWRGLDPAGGHKKWGYTLWDNDATFAFYINYTGIKDTSANASLCQHEILKGNSDPKGHVKVLNQLRKNKDFNQYYVTRQIDLLNTVFSKKNMLTYFDSVYNTIKPEMPRQIARWGGTMTGWEANVKRLRSFIDRRCDAVQTNIKPCYGLTGPYPVTLAVDQPQVVKEIQFNSQVITQFPWSGMYYGGIDNKISLSTNNGTSYTFDKWLAPKSKFSTDSTKNLAYFKLTASDTIRAIFKKVSVSVDDNFLTNNNLSIYPTVANTNTTVEFFLPESMPVRVELFDIKGQKVANLAYQIFQEGDHQETFDLSNYNLSNGLYIMKFSAGKYSTSSRMLIQR